MPVIHTPHSAPLTPLSRWLEMTDTHKVPIMTSSLEDVTPLITPQRLLETTMATRKDNAKIGIFEAKLEDAKALEIVVYARRRHRRGDATVGDKQPTSDMGMQRSDVNVAAAPYNLGSEAQVDGVIEPVKREDNHKARRAADIIPESTRRNRKGVESSRSPQMVESRSVADGLERHESGEALEGESELVTERKAEVALSQKGLTSGQATKAEEHGRGRRRRPPRKRVDDSGMQWEWPSLGGNHGNREVGGSGAGTGKYEDQGSDDELFRPVEQSGDGTAMEALTSSRKRKRSDVSLSSNGSSEAEGLEKSTEEQRKGTDGMQEKAMTSSSGEDKGATSSSGMFKDPQVQTLRRTALSSDGKNEGGQLNRVPRKRGGGTVGGTKEKIVEKRGRKGFVSIDQRKGRGKHDAGERCGATSDGFLAGDTANKGCRKSCSSSLPSSESSPPVESDVSSIQVGPLAKSLGSASDRVQERNGGTHISSCALQLKGAQGGAERSAGVKNQWAIRCAVTLTTEEIRRDLERAGWAKPRGVRKGKRGRKARKTVSTFQATMGLCRSLFTHNLNVRYDAEQIQFFAC
eukprot:TRINITY_DN23415_c0_g1_i1.p1 TRINITY_DN23415_c0_g1~~TRINITY_DN23415_c0_g1_i1.p1  ORF type:complete len:576 (-),score=83.62 TRINITY_DN23415_c0_g1_i1:477-2204(-)